MAKKISFIDYSEFYDEAGLITTSEGYKKTKDSEFDPKGIYSEEIFGNYYADNNDITRRGWIKLVHPLINPLMYIMMKKKKLITEEDESSLMEIIDTLEHNPSLFLEDKRNAKTNALIDFIYANHKFLIIHAYPVFSHKLRPITLLNGVKPTLIYDKVNQYFALLIEYNNTIAKSLSPKNYDNEDFVKAMQEKINTITQFITSNVLSKKQGVLRKEVLGMRINFSSRAVITPLTGDFEIDDVSMPYRVAVEIYKYQIINILARIKNINYNEALRIHELGQLEYNTEIYSIMQSLLNNTKGGLKILLGRNPTISIGSIMYLNVAEIKKDYSDSTISISNNILGPYAAD